jgi:aspartate--ammonia ligase
MNAIRRDEDLDNLHSVYVDQWDWERIILKEERNEETLRDIVNSIYRVFKDSENFILKRYPQLESYLPDEITFITSQELEDKYPGLNAKEREDAISKEHKAVFIMKIGGKLSSGEPHDGRAPDYDDWELNGDIIFWFPILERAFEVSSMGIRVDKEALIKQLKLANCEDRKDLLFHSELLNGRLPYTIGGGIGQSRICMFLLNKAHIGEVQSSVWPDEMHQRCQDANMILL